MASARPPAGGGSESLATKPSLTPQVAADMDLFAMVEYLLDITLSQST